MSALSGIGAEFCAHKKSGAEPRSPRLGEPAATLTGSLVVEGVGSSRAQRRRGPRRRLDVEGAGARRAQHMHKKRKRDARPLPHAPLPVTHVSPGHSQAVATPLRGDEELSLT